jgi:hypothetical protein
MTSETTIRTAIAALSLVLLSQFGCSHNREPEDFLTPDGWLKCETEWFTAAIDEHITNQNTKPFVVRRIQGRITDTEGRAIWYKDLPLPLFEIRAFGVKDARTYKAFADKNGYFKIDGIPEGRYCFKTMLMGWQSEMGIIIVRKRADPKSSITLRLLIGV